MGLANLHYDVTIIQDEEVTAAVLVTEEGLGWNPTGSAKKHPKDKHSNKIGQMVALSRLFRQMADDYETGARQLQEKVDPGITIEIPPALRQWLAGKGVPDQEL
jgi:hypothetical protein